MAFQGSLKELPLPDIIQLVAVSQKSGVFSIEDGRSSGKIFLHDGQIIDAEVGDLRGEEAVYELSIWGDGRFQFDPDSSVALASPTIEKSNANLLLEAARRKDEWRILGKKIPSTKMVPVVRPSGTGRRFNPREGVVVEKIDGARTIEGIGLELDESPFEVAKVVYGLVTSGAVELQEHSVSAAENDQQAPAAEGRFDGLSVRQIAEVSTAVFATAFEMVESRDSLTGLEALRRESETPDRPLTPTERITDLVRGAQQLIAREQGPEQAEVFLDRVEELFQEV